MDTLETLENGSGIGKNKYGLFLRLFFIVMFIAQVAVVGVFCMGTVRIFGKSTDVISMVNVLLGIFDIGPAYYRDICSIIVAAVYLIILLSGVRGLFTSFSTARTGFGMISSTSNVHNNKNFWNIYWSMPQEIMRAFIKISGFVVTVTFIRTAPVEKTVLLPLIIAVSAFILARILYYFINRYTIISILTNIAYYIILIASVGLIIINAHTGAAIESIFNRLMSLFFIEFEFLPIAVCFIDIIKNVLMMTIVYSAIRVINAACTYTPFSRNEIQDRGRPIIYSICTMVVLDIIGCALISGNITVDTIISLATPYLPLALATAAQAMFIYLPKANDKRAASSHAKNIHTAEQLQAKAEMEAYEAAQAAARAAEAKAYAEAQAAAAARIAEKAKERAEARSAAKAKAEEAARIAEIAKEEAERAAEAAAKEDFPSNEDFLY